MTTFGYKTAWLAFEGGLSPTEVSGLLDLQHLRAAAWPDAVAAAYRVGPEVLVTPPLSGAGSRRWTLVSGCDLHTTDGDLADLSRDLGGEVQWFTTHRVVESHAWSRAVNGAVVRRFWTVGESGECGSIGEPDSVEAGLGVPPPSDDDEFFDAVIDAGIDEQTVMRVAGGWSIDPQTLAAVAGLYASIGSLPAHR